LAEKFLVLDLIVLKIPKNDKTFLFDDLTLKFSWMIKKESIELNFELFVMKFVNEENFLTMLLRIELEKSLLKTFSKTLKMIEERDFSFISPFKINFL
jgi:hypothetical protein